MVLVLNLAFSRVEIISKWQLLNQLELEAVIPGLYFNKGFWPVMQKTKATQFQVCPSNPVLFCFAVISMDLAWE